jgi:hypothetical protein
LERRDLPEGNSWANEVQVKPPKSLIKVPPVRRPRARTAELILFQNVISFSRNFDPTAIDLQAGTWPEGVPRPRA